MSTKAEIIAQFNLYIDDMSELSTSEEDALFEKIYQQICSERQWEFLKTEFSGTQSSSVPYVALPSDFASVTQNHNTTGVGFEAESPVVFVGSTYKPVRIVNWSDRRQFRDRDDVAWIDIANSRLVFAKQPTVGEAIEFDYIKVPDTLASNESPIFPVRFHDAIYHGMCVDSFIIQQSEKARSYAPENKQRYNDYIESMAYWNSQLVQLN